MAENRQIGFKKTLPWLMWGLAACFYYYEFSLQVSASVMVPELMKAFSVNATALGTLAGLYFWAYAAMQIPAGMLLDKLGPRRLLTIAVTCCALGAFTFGSATHLYVASIGRILIGLGSSFAAIGCLQIAAIWLPSRRFALITGIMLTIGMLGAASGQAPLALLVERLDWRNSLYVLSAIGIVLAILLYTVIRNKKASPSATTHAKKRYPTLHGLVCVLRNRQSWITAIYGSLMYTPTLVLGALWGVPFLVQAGRMNRPFAATIISLLFFGWAAGAPFFGWLSDTMCRRKPNMIIGSVGTFILLVYIIYYPGIPHVLLGIALFFFGFFSSGFLMVFSIVRETNAPQTCATALGFTNALNMIGGAIAQPFIGWLLDSHWHGGMMHGVRIYSVANYHVALVTLPICVFIALTLTPFIKETHCVQAQ